MRALALTLALTALVAVGCKVSNPFYCGDYDCDAGTDRIEATVSDGGGADTSDAGGRDAADTKLVCRGDDDCRGDAAGPACDTTSGACVPCVRDEHCSADGGTSVCDMTAHRCVVCRDSAQCGAAKPVCDLTAAPVCRACRMDAECGGPGVCLDDGHCAGNDEVIFVQNSSGCPAARAGTPQSPFCRPQEAMAALQRGRSVVLVTGPQAVTGWSLLAPVAGVDVVTVLGKAQASVDAGGDPGVKVSGGVHMVIRDLQFVRSGGVGITADTGADLTLTRCLVAGNEAGGIQIIGARFDITNTIIAGNKAGSVGSSGFGGAYLNARSTSPPSRFASNTVANNASTAIACEEPYAIAASIVLPTTGQLAVAGCMPLPACCGTGDPKLDPTTFKLLAGSSCIDKLDPSLSTPLDFDAQSRPRNGLSDCGADEY